MSKISLIFSLGILVVVIPWTGFLNNWKTIFYTIIGVSISMIVLLLRKEIDSLRRALRSREHIVTDSFVQNSHIDTYGRAGKISSEGHAKNIIN